MSMVLEKTLKDQVEKLNLPKTKRRHAYNLINIYLEDQRLRNLPLEDQYKDLSKKYMRQVFGGRYLEWFKPLIEEGIIQEKKRKGKGYGKGQSKSYRINPSLRTGELICIKQEETPYHIVATFLTSDLSDLEVRADFDSLVINEAKLKSRMWKYIDSISTEQFKVDYGISDDKIKVFDRKYKDSYWTTRDRAIITAHKRGANLIQDKSKCYIDNIETYVRDKKKSIKVSYERMIFKLVNRIYFVNRNGTNGRLDSNYTCLSKILLDVIIEDNNLMELDVCNCQFAILSMLYKKYRDSDNLSYQFYDYYARKGLLYEFLEHKLGLEKRSRAKSLMFEVCFSSHRFRSPGKDSVKNIFGEVMDFIDWYKKTYGDRQLPITLQQEESKLFIDGVLNQIKSSNLFCISRHDSILVKRSEAFQAFQIMRKVFNEVGFENCTINSDWDTEHWLYDFSYHFYAA